MSERFTLGERLGPLVERIVQGYEQQPITRHVDRQFLPSRRKIIRLSKSLLELIFPGFFGRQGLTRHNVAFHIGDLLPRIGKLVYSEVFNCLCYARETEGKEGAGGGTCREKASLITEEFIQRLPAVREVLATDVKAAYEGDPAAINMDEVILAYPGLLATAIHRLAHELYGLSVPLMPRVMAEWAHAMTGIDIHPGARIGRAFFIDHGTGVVIGETAFIGDRVKLYQGVTLGALSIPRDERGRAIRGVKRHPTVEDDVTLYANAIVLGGETVVGRGAVIGGSVFITSSVPPYSTVTFKPPELHYRKRGDGPAPAAGAKGGRKGASADGGEADPPFQMPDYQI